MNIKSIGSKIKGNPKMVEGTVYSMLIICSISHFLNDMIQSIIPSIYPIVKDKFDFSFAQIGIITLVFQMTSSILQPFTGLFADKHPRPYALSLGMCFTLVGLLLLAFAENYFLILLAVSVVGLGSSVFHPTASRVAQMASGGKKSLAQSIFQVGGNGGSAVGPLLAAIIILPFGQHAISWFALAALLAAIIMVRLGVWYKARLAYVVNHPQKQPLLNTHISKRVKYWALFILIMLVFSKYFYTACITSYFTFFLMDKFGVSVQTSQLCLFVFLAAFAIGTVAGGMLGDKFGRKYVIWFSILGAAPFAIAMPFVNFTWTIIFTFLSGLIIASAFSSIVVYATDLMPDKVGKSVESKLNKILSRHPDLVMETLQEVKASSANTIHNTSVQVYGVSAFVIMFSIFNLTNTLISRISTRRKEFGILESIGMTKKQIKKMLLHESVLLIIPCLIITVVAGTLMGYLLVRILSANGLTYFQYAFPFIPLLIYGVCLIITPIIISAICLKIQCRNSLVERIKMAD